MTDSLTQARSSATRAVENAAASGTDSAAARINTTADDVRNVSTSLSDQGMDTAAQLATRAADLTQRAADYLRDSTPQQILEDVEDMGRRQPWAMLVGGLVVGFAASRFVRASTAHRGTPAPARLADSSPAADYHEPMAPAQADDGLAWGPGYDAPAPQVPPSYIQPDTHVQR